MSGDVQPRKRKEKRKKKDSEEIGSNFSSEEHIHIHKDASTGGHICAKILFFCLSLVLLIMIGLILFEYRGSSDDDGLVSESKWEPVFAGWLEMPSKHEEHSAVTDGDEHEDQSEAEESGEHEGGESREAEEEEEPISEEKDSKEQEEDDDEDGEEDRIEDQEEEETSKELRSGELDEDDDHDSIEEDEEQTEEEQEEEEEAVDGEEEEEEEDDDEPEHSQEDNTDEDETEENEELDELEDQDESEEYRYRGGSRDDNLKEIPGVTESDENNDEDELDKSAEETTKQDDSNEGADNASESKEHDDREDVIETVKDEMKQKDEAGKLEDEEDEPEPSGSPKARRSARAHEDKTTTDSEVPMVKHKSSKTAGGEKSQSYAKADITSGDDWNIIQELDAAEQRADENLENSVHLFESILKSHPKSPRALYGKAAVLDRLAEKKKSNFVLEQAIETYQQIMSLGYVVNDKLFTLAAERCIDRMRFIGSHSRAVQIHKFLMKRFPDNPAYANQLAVTYLMINRLSEAKQVLKDVLQKWPNNGFAQVHYGFILKTGDNNMIEAVKYLQQGIASRESGTIDGRFFFQLGDALMRLGRRKEAMDVNELGVKEGLFLSKYQRSLYNVDRLRAQPWWTPEETTYENYFRKLQEHWKEIKNEALKALYEKNNNNFKDEAENLRDRGKWKQLELFARGRKITSNCAKAPVTCKLIDEFPAAKDCRRGQVKFSVMDPGTHVWPHCGPTNCRLRSHLGLVVPKGTFIRVAEETRTWEEGKLFIFDDSFEHEVWHNGSTTRLVLITDVWHPELTAEERRSLPAI